MICLYTNSSFATASTVVVCGKDPIVDTEDVRDALVLSLVVVVLVVELVVELPTRVREAAWAFVSVCFVLEIAVLVVVVVLEEEKRRKKEDSLEGDNSRRAI